MVDVVLFHSVLGLRQVERDIAAARSLRARRLILPDLYQGARSDDYDEGFRLNQAIGQAALEARARAAAAEAPADAVLGGVSFGAFLVGGLWAERPAMPGALLLCGVAPWMEPRRAGLPVSVHLARPDPFDDEEFFADWAFLAGPVALDMHRYDGVGHLFLDRTLPDYDAAAAGLCLERARALLDAL